MKRKKYTAKLLSMAVAANLIFSSFAMPVVSAETGTVGAEAVREAGMADGSDGNGCCSRDYAVAGWQGRSDEGEYTRRW